MDIFLTQDLSVYQLALDTQVPLQPLSVSPATLLSLVRSQVDLLIEQKLAATLWVKLPPGKIWHSEIQRYSQQLSKSCVIFTHLVEHVGQRKQEFATENLSLSSSRHVYLLPDSQLRREYFFLVLSPQLCSLTLIYRPLKRQNKTVLRKVNSNQTSSLIAMNTFDGKAIQQVLDGVRKSVPAELSLLLLTDFPYPLAPEPMMMSQLFAKQVQHQDQINRQITIEKIAKVQEQSQKLHNNLQLKDKYLISVCQELRTPITHMKTALSLLNSPNLKISQRQRYLQMLNAQCERQNSLITGMLTLVEIENNLEGIALESVRLSEVVPGVVSTYQPLAHEKGIMLAYTVPPELPPVWCVSGGIKQIMINLLSNSIKFTPNGGQVWVRCRVHGNYVHLEIQDNGIGIAESEIPQVFEPFYRVRSTTTEDSGGVGLGLTIVQQLLWHCGGSISVQSKLYSGSIFTVKLVRVNE
jgi:signal transduction histidine kinase